jgi:hypothetical protein
MSLYPLPKDGDRLKVPARGFPCFYGNRRLRRIITGDIWSFLHHISQKTLNKPDSVKASSYIDQAFDFYTAAGTPRQSSRPLLYYYAFLNLAKVLLLHKGINLPPVLKHGIFDPKANARQRLRLAGQIVGSSPLSSQHSEVFPEIVNCLSAGTAAAPMKKMKIIDLLSQIPAIHRTFCAVTSSEPSFCPIKLEIVRDKSCIWARMFLNKNDRDTKTVIKSIGKNTKFSQLFHRITSTEKHVIAYESTTKPFSTRNIDMVIGKLAQEVYKIGIWTIFTEAGYSLYMHKCSNKPYLPQLASAYAVMFYLGSITRYKPYDFDKIFKGYSWLINEFLDTQPVQVLHIIASYLAETEVVSPHAKRIASQ